MLNLKKAYDSVDLAFLFDIMKVIDFQNYTSSGSSSASLDSLPLDTQVVINGKMHGNFPVKRGQ